jgi:glycosyltransferase involved in cell wall biosynthesis
MRIMHILKHIDRQNGHVHAAVDLACEQKRLGNQVAIVSAGGDFDGLLASHQVESLYLCHERRPVKIIQSVLALRRHVLDWQPDVVHAHMMTSAVFAYPVCKLTRTPLITTVHNEFQKSAILMGLGTSVIAVSDAVCRSMQKRGVRKRKLHVVLNGTIGAARHANRALDAANLSHPNVVFVGGLHPRKGVADLINAFSKVRSRYPKARLYIVGSGPMAEEYHQLAHATCGDSVTFVGSLDDPYPYMVAADIFVLPSLADPAPLVISEAREAGCAVIGTAVDGIPQLLEFGKAGLLVPPSQPDLLASAIGDLFADVANLRRWKERSQYRLEHLTIERVARETSAIYESALS